MSRLSTINREQLRSIPGILEQIPLAKYSTYRIGGPAAFLLEATSIDALADSVRLARRASIPVAVLGGGSNTLIADRGFDGLVVVARCQQLQFRGTRVRAEAGVKISVLTVLAAHHGLGGLRFLIGVPGTVGGAVYGNAGARDIAIGNRIVSVTILDADGELRELSRDACQFDYRMSRFKQTKEVVLRAELELPVGDPKALAAEIAQVVRAKNAKQPTHEQSAGCMFKNVSVPDPHVIPASLHEYLTDGQLSSWRLIAAAGLQGKQIGRVQVSPIHANFLVNRGGATAEEVVLLLSYIKQQVRDRFGVQLHEEVQYLGFDQAAD